MSDTSTPPPDPNEGRYPRYAVRVTSSQQSFWTKIDVDLLQRQWEMILANEDIQRRLR